MPKRIDQLTDQQREAMADHAQKWIAIGQSTEPADWDIFATGAEACYGYANIPWHNNIIHVSNPLVLSLAAPIAAALIEHATKTKQPRRGAVGGAVGGAVDVAVGDAVRGAVRVAVGDAVRGAVRVAVGGAVDDAVDGAVDGAVGDAVRVAVRVAVDDAVRVAVGGAVGVAVDDAVGDAVRVAVRGAALKDIIRRYWYYRLGGQWWVNWQAYTSFFRDVCGLELDGDLWDRAKAYEQAQSSAGWWWPHRQFTMVCDRPAVLHLEQVAPTGWGSHRLHCADGPAIAWRDGYALHYWHGTRVPADLIERGWSVKDIFAERNAEVRRCAIEKIGWGALIDQLALVSKAPDPGNAPYYLCLYDLPDELSDMYEEDARILLCVNGTVERNGERRRYGLPVPGHHTDPVVAAAELYDMPVEAYRRLQVRR